MDANLNGHDVYAVTRPALLMSQTDLAQQSQLTDAEQVMPLVVAKGALIEPVNTEDLTSS